MIKYLTNRWVHFVLLLALLAGALVFSTSAQNWRVGLQSFVFDSLNRMYPREKTNQVIIVDIDDDSLLRIGQWPWPRTVIADLVTDLTALGAKAIAFDGVLAEPDRTSPRAMLQSLPKNMQQSALGQEISALPDHDDVLAAAIQKSGVFVSGFTYGSYTQNPRPPYLSKPVLVKNADLKEFVRHAERFAQTASFLPVLERSAAGNGSFMAKPDHDGVLRRTGLVFSDGKMLYPSLSLEAVRVALGHKKLVTKIGRNPNQNRGWIDTAYRILVGEAKIPVESDGVLRVYARVFEEKGGDYVPAFKILDSSMRAGVAAQIKDKIVLIGSSAEGLKDLRSTALEAFQPGVEIHANVIEQILQGRYLLRPQASAAAEMVFILCVGLLIIAFAPFIHVFLLGGLCGALILTAFLGTVVAYRDYGLLFDPFYPSLSVFVIFMASMLLTFLRVEHEKKQVRSAFGHYISPDFMAELTKNPEKLKLGGETRELTVMFSDIRSFTTICEGLSPEDIIQLMNDFLTPMSDLVMQNRGTIDKYMGDAMMAFWNAPLEDALHARHACETALGMQAALAPVNAGIQQKAEMTGKKPVLLSAGIGLNSGPCAVGNMGSKQRFAYSTLGDAVNLASRLEGQTKTYGVDILIGENTWLAVPEFASLEMDLIKVVGKSKPVRVFALLGGEDIAQSAAFKALKEQHDSMVAHYRAGRFAEALASLAECRKQTLFALDKAYNLYETRIKDALENPPPEGWDGVYEAKGK